MPRSQPNAHSACSTMFRPWLICFPSGLKATGTTTLWDLHKTEVQASLGLSGFLHLSPGPLLSWDPCQNEGPLWVQWRPSPSYRGQLRIRRSLKAWLSRPCTSLPPPLWPCVLIPPTGPCSFPAVPPVCPENNLGRNCHKIIHKLYLQDPLEKFLLYSSLHHL